MRASELRLDSSDRFSRQSPLSEWRLAGAFALWAMAGASYSLWELWRRGTSSTSPPATNDAHASMIVALVLCSASLGWIAWRLRPARNAVAMSQGVSLLGWLRAFCVGMTLSYMTIAQFAAPGAEGPLLMAAGAGWGALISLPLATDPLLCDRLRRWLDRRGPRRAGAALFYGCMIVAGIEGSLRWCGAVWGPDFFTPRPRFHVTYSPSRGPTIDRSKSLSFARATLRVAVLGESSTTGVEDRMSGRSGDASSNASHLESAALGGSLAPVEFALPGLDIVHIAASGARLTDYVREGLPRACAERPDLLLVFISVADDLVGDAPPRGAFGGDGLASARVVARWTNWRLAADDRPEAAALKMPADSIARTSAGQSSTATRPSRWEDYVRMCGPQLIACRKPVDPAMQSRWKSLFASLDALDAKCRAENIPLALVVTPSPLQTNGALLEAVCRRQGCGKQDIDLDLPQRRLVVYASQHKRPALDLLPSLRQSSEQPFVHQSRTWTEAGRATIARTLDSWLRSTFATMLLPGRVPVAAAWNPADEDRLVAH